MNQRNSLSKQNTDCLKGIFAILVVISHSRNHMAALNDTILGSMLTSAGYLAVAIFFFLSGYGIETQYQRKGKAYIEQFPRKRILSIFLISVVSVLVYACFKQFVYGGITIRDLVLSVLFGQTILAYGWYLQAIVLLYILYYLSHKILPEDKQIVELFIGLIVYIACSVIFADTMLYCQSILAFPFGLVYAHVRN